MINWDFRTAMTISLQSFNWLLTVDLVLNIEYTFTWDSNDTFLFFNLQLNFYSGGVEKCKKPE